MYMYANGNSFGIAQGQSSIDGPADTPGGGNMMLRSVYARLLVVAALPTSL